MPSRLHARRLGAADAGGKHAVHCSAPMMGARSRKSDGIQDERLRLWPTQPAVERDQLLERAAFFQVWVVEAADHDVRHVRESVGPKEMPSGVRERRQRVLALDGSVRQVVRSR